jgi:hypothetical protein
MRWELARQVRQALTDAQFSLPLRTRELHIVSSEIAATASDSAAGQAGSSAIREPERGA